MQSSVSRPCILSLAEGGPVDGAQQQLLYLAAGLPRERFDMVVAIRNPGDFGAELQRVGVEFLDARMASWRSVTRLAERHVDARALASFARYRSINVVHANDIWRAGYARFVARRLSIPYVAHMRGPLSPGEIRKNRLHDADHIIAVATRYVDDLRVAGIAPERITLIDDGVDLGAFDPCHVTPDFLARQYGLAPAPLVVGMVGRIARSKRNRAFLDIIAKLPPEHQHATRFVMVGEREKSDYGARVERAAAQFNLAERVHLLPRCPNRLMPSLLGSLDLLVTLSGGSVMFQAMAVGTPVMSVAAAGRHSAHTQHGLTAWCVSGDDPAVAADALARLLSDADLRRRLGEAGREHVRQHLSAADMVEKTGALFARLAS